MTTDTSEKGLETLIVTAMTGAGWIAGASGDYDREYAVDIEQVLVFLLETQPDTVTGLNIEEEGPARRKFLARLQGETTKRGIIDVLRGGVKHGPHHVDFFGTPTPGNAKAEARYAQNRFAYDKPLEEGTFVAVADLSLDVARGPS